MIKAIRLERLTYITPRKLHTQKYDGKRVEKESNLAQQWKFNCIQFCLVHSYWYINITAQFKLITKSLTPILDLTFSILDNIRDVHRGLIPILFTIFNNINFALSFFIKIPSNNKQKTRKFINPVPQATVQFASCSIYTKYWKNKQTYFYLSLK